MLVTVIVCGELVEPTFCARKIRLLGEREISGPTRTLEMKASHWPATPLMPALSRASPDGSSSRWPTI